MDQKKILDPKLKEAYDRVMNTSIPVPSKTTTPPAPTPPSSSKNSGPEMVSIHNPSVSKKQAAAPIRPTTTFVAGEADEKSKSSGVSPVLIIILVLVFLIGYAVFWVKFFNINLPFLP